MTERRSSSTLARTALAVAAAAALSACGLLTPKYERPAAPVAELFYNDTAAAGSKAASDIGWQDFFVDPRLKRLIEISLANNRDLRVAVLTVEQTRATYRIVNADRFPTVNAGVIGQRAPATPPATGINTLYTAGLQVPAYELDLFGRVHSLSEAAFSRYLATEEGRKAAQISLIANVATTYIALQASEQLLELARNTVGTREESMKLQKLKFDNGAASELDLRQNESLLEAARVALAASTRERMQNENALVLLIGQPLPKDLPLGLAMNDQRLNAELPAGLPSDLLIRRPDVRQAEQQLIAANANIGAARAAFFPRITLTGQAGRASSELSNLFDGGGSTAWSFVANLLLPIFDAGRNLANLEANKVGKEIAVAQYEKAIQSAFRDVNDALAGRATLGEQSRAQTAQARAEEARFRLSDLRYRNGASSYLDVLDAQRSQFAAQQAAVQVQALQVQNLVAVYRALGGGWSEPGATPAAAAASAGK